MFHIGHLNLLENAKKQCEVLIVGVNSDELVLSYKHKPPVIGEANRKRIIESLKVVDDVVITDTLDKLEMHRLIGFDAIFIGDDWKESERWAHTTADLAKIDVEVVFIPYTKDISSTLLRGHKDERVDDK